MAAKPPWDEQTPADFEPALIIDKHNLDEEIERQADLVYRVSQQVTLAISRRDEAKADLLEVEGRIEVAIRKNAGEGRTTDKQVEARRNKHPKVVAARKAVIKANYELGKWNDIKEGLVNRGFAMRNLVDLYVNEYYAAKGISGRGDMKEIDAGLGRRAMNAARKGKS